MGRSLGCGVGEGCVRWAGGHGGKRAGRRDGLHRPCCRRHGHTNRPASAPREMLAICTACRRAAGPGEGAATRQLLRGNTKMVVAPTGAGAPGPHNPRLIGETFQRCRCPQCQGVCGSLVRVLQKPSSSRAQAARSARVLPSTRFMVNHPPPCGAAPRSSGGFLDHRRRSSSTPGEKLNENRTGKLDGYLNTLAYAVLPSPSGKVPRGLIDRRSESAGAAGNHCNSKQTID